MKFKNTTPLAVLRPLGSVVLGLSSVKAAIHFNNTRRAGKALGLLLAISLGTLPLQSARADLLAHYTFDETSGTTADNTGTLGSANNGTLLNEAAFTTSGFLGGGLSLSGSGYVNAGYSPITGTTARTVSVWVKTTTTTLSTLVSFGSNGSNGTGGGSNGNKWDFDIDGVNGGVVELGVGGGRSVGSGTAVNDGAWHLLTVVLPSGANNLNQTLIYVDGVYQYTSTVSKAVNTTSGATTFFNIGDFVNVQTARQYVTGTLDDVSIWNSGFSATQVEALYSLGKVASLDAGDVDKLLASFNGTHSDVTIDSTTWTYEASGIGGANGTTLALGNGSYSVNLGSGAGFVVAAVPEPTTVALLLGGAIFTLGARRLRRSKLA